MAGESGVLVLVEHRAGQITGLATEMLGAASRLSLDPVTAVAFGTGAGEAGKLALSYGAAAALVCEDAQLDEYRNETWTAALTAAARELNPAAVLLGQTPVGRDLAPRFAIRAGSGVAMDCIDLAVQDGTLVMTRPCYGGNAHAAYTSKTTPAVATIRGKAFEPITPDASRGGEVKTLAFQPPAPVTRVVSREQVQSEGMRLEDATVVVSGGRGLGGPEAFEQLAELAQVLGGAVGASRAAVDLGWVPLTSQIGLTGKVVTPDLYIAVAISGASQHLAGITGARNVVAINKDGDADIFKVARYGAVTEWKAFLAAFTEECRRLKA
jgi:electron transfer flavoprotein alpha subunit